MSKRTLNNKTFIPNSFQVPNDYCDELMYLLTPAEWKVLSYAARRIFGFGKRKDYISLSQFMHGTLSRKRTEDSNEEKHLDWGTGLSKPAVVASLESLIRYRLMFKLAENDPRKNYGDLYALQLDCDKVDYDGLIDRANDRAMADVRRTIAGRNGAKAKRLSIYLPGQSDLPGEPVSGIDRGRSVGLTGAGQSDRPEPVSGIDTQYTEEIQRKQQGCISHPDFDRALVLIKERYPTDTEQAGPVLLESDDKPYRLRVKLSSLPPDFIEHLTDALRDANPRRHYRLEFETPATGREHAKPSPEAVKVEQFVNEYAPTEQHLQIWQAIMDELSTNSERPGTHRWAMERARIRDVIVPARLLAVNGSWTVGVPSVLEWKSSVSFSVKRIYQRNTGQTADFVFVELPNEAPA